VLVLLVGAAVVADTPRLRASIVRTAFGVAHIVASGWADAGFGEGYAFAEDNLCVLAEDVVTLDGARSRWFGLDGRVRDLANGLDTDNLSSDFFYRRLNQAKVVEGLQHTDPPTARARDLVRGYAAGYNAYLAHVGGAAGVTDPACRGAAWVRPITELDLWRRLYQLSLLTTSLAYLPALIAAVSPGSAQPAVGKRPGSLRAGSNAWGLGAESTKDGAAILLGNPHFPWSGPERFWEVQLTVPGQADVEGATLAGVPGVLIGFNQHVAWSFTVSAASAAAVYELDLVPGDPTAYRYDGAVRRMTSQVVTVDGRGAGGRLEQRRKTFWSAVAGPLIVADQFGLGWTANKAYALFDPNAANLRLLDTIIAVDTSTSTADLHAGLRRFEGLPWVNTIAVDAGGRALFADVSVVPHLPDAQLARCATELGERGTAPLPVLDGSDSKCLPGADADSAAPGIFGGAELPSLTRTDYVANSNDGPWLTNPTHPLTGFPAVTADRRYPPSLRSRLGLTMIRQRIAGTDGLPGPRFDLATTEQVALNDRNYTAELVLPDLVKLCRTRVDLAPACAVLAQWNGHDGLADAGAVLFHEFLRLAFADDPDGGAFFADQYDPLQPLRAPGKLNVAGDAVLGHLADAVRLLNTAQVPLDAAWGSVQSAWRSGRRIPMHGSDDPGVFNVVDSVLDPAAHGYPGVTSGVTFLLAVEMTTAGPHADAILAYSQSQDPTSAHHDDQTLLYSQSRWAHLPFTRAEVRAASTSTLDVTG